ncbi:MAG: GNAT family N-acetyltransferase [Paludibacteraceae bacterium]|nr:GNAT family N-acetyltransferase [Paludibacteraceae bacterium]
MEEKIIDPVPVELIEAELTEERLLRRTNKANNLLYVVNAHNAPNTMREIGRLREFTFRAAGGGTGKSCDIDEFDTMDEPCQQMIVWNPDAKEIVGGYRFIFGDKVKYDEKGQPILATSHLFKFSRRFLREYMPYVLELGRSFVTPEYQSSKQGTKSLYALDNLWDGMGALVVQNPKMKYFFGKVTMYPSYGTMGRDMILYFMKKYFGDKNKLIVPYNPLKMETRLTLLQKIFPGLSLSESYATLKKELKNIGLKLPPLVSSYISLSGTMVCFGTAINDTFGNVEETGIMVTIDDIYDEKRERHIQTYLDELMGKLNIKQLGV